MQIKVVAVKNEGDRIWEKKYVGIFSGKPDTLRGKGKKLTLSGDYPDALDVRLRADSHTHLQCIIHVGCEIISFSRNLLPLSKMAWRIASGYSVIEKKFTESPWVVYFEILEDWRVR